MKKLIIVGISSTARHAYHFIRMYKLYEVIGFAVNQKYKKENFFYGLPVYSLEALKEECSENDFEVFIAVLWNHLNRDRKTLYDYCKSQNYKLANLISPTAIIRGKIIGDNCWIHDYVVVQNDAYIGADVVIMAFTLIGANTHISAHCFFGARSLLGGGSRIGAQSFVGLNATIFDGTQIGEKCIVGACTAIKRNMPNFSKCIVATDIIVMKQYTEDIIEDKLISSLNRR